MSNYQSAVRELIKSIQYMVKEALSNTTKCYSGIVKSEANGNKWNIQFNGETHAILKYGDIQPKTGMVVKVFVPQNNMSLAFFI